MSVAIKFGIICFILAVATTETSAVDLSDRLVIANKMLTLPPAAIDPSSPYWWTVPTRPWDQHYSSRPSAWCTNLSATNMRVQGYIDEINQAKAYGIDGFIVCITSTTQSQLDAWNATLAAAQTVGDFYVCLQPDLTTGLTPQTLKPFVDAAASSPACLRINNLPLIVPYCAGYGTPASEKTTWVDWYAAQGTPISYIPSLFLDHAKYKENQLAWKDTTAGYPLFAAATVAFSPLEPDLSRQRALDYWQGNGSLPFISDVAFQYQNTAVGYLNNHGSRVFRNTFEWCIENRNNGVSWVQPLCWNDFHESAFAPNSNLFMALAPISKYYADWFKSGTMPEVTTDSVSIFHRRYPANATPSQYSFYGNTGTANEVEAVTLLMAPATLYLQTGGTTYTASVSAGIQSLTQPFNIGVQKAWVVRNGVTVASVISPVPVISNPIQSNVWTTGYTSAYPPENVPLTNWSTLSGSITASGTVASGTGVALVGDALALIDYRISATVTPSSAASGNSTGVIVYAQGNSYFSFAIGNWNNVTGWRVSRIDAGTETALLSGTTSYGAAQARTIRLDKVGDYLVCYLDGNQVGCTADWGTPNISSSDMRWGYGKGGVFANGASASFTGITIERYQANLSNIVAKPTFSVAAGCYATAQAVTIATTTGGATIRYTTDGSTPTAAHGTVFSGPVTISSSQTLKAFAYKANVLDSYVQSAQYIISATSQVAAPAFSVAAGTYSGPSLVTAFSPTPGALVRYTLDGSTPTKLYGYQGPTAIVGTSATLKAIAYLPGMTDSAVTSATYTITPSTGWVQIGTTGTNVYSTTDSALTEPTFSTLGDMPAALAVSGGTIPDMKVSYRLVMNGVSGWGNQTSGRQGLMLFSGTTPNIDDGLFSGVDDWNYKTYGAIAENTGQPLQPMGYPCLYDNTVLTGNPDTCDVTMEVVNGIVKTTLQTILPAGIPNCVQTYLPTADDINEWAGQTKFGAFRGGPGTNYQYSRALVSNVSFFRRTGWVQIGNTDTNVYSTPNSAIKAPAFSTLGDMPPELAISGGVIPDMKVTYHLVVQGVTGWGIQASGRQGLMLYSGTTPNIDCGLFSGVNDWSYKTYGSLAGNTGQPPQPTGPFLFDNVVLSGNPDTFDVTLEIVNGVAKTTMQTISPAGIPTCVVSYSTTAGDINAWTGQMKFGAFRGGLGSNYAYSRAIISNIGFFRRP